MPLFLIIDKWVHQKNQKNKNLGWDSEALHQLFETRHEKRYPILGRIGILSEQLIITAQHSLADSALFAWSLMESTQWRSILCPNEESLTGFRDALLSDLRNRDASHLLAQLEDGIFQPSYAKPSSEFRLPESKESESPYLNLAETTGDQIDAANIQQLGKLFIGKISELDNLVEQAVGEHFHAETALKCVLSSDCAVKEINEISNSLESLRSLVCTLETGATDLENKIADVVSVALRRLPLGIDPIESPKFSLATFEQWRNAAASRYETAKGVLLVANKLMKFDDDLIGIAMSAGHERTISLERAQQFLEAIEDKATILSRGLAAIRAFQLCLQARQDDFLWNPVIDSSIALESWIHIGEYLAAQDSTPVVLGICARKCYKQLQAKVTELVDHLACRDEISLEFAFNVLENLTLGQIEGIECRSEEGRTLLAAFELQSFLHCADRSPTEAYVLWSAKPLSGYVNDQALTPSERFFGAAFKASSADGVAPLSIAELRRLLTFPDSSSLSSSTDLRGALKDKLLSVLEFHPGGGQTYAQLWELAYQAICMPVTEKAKKGDLDDAAELCRQIRKNFSIEEHLHSWKCTIPERLRKRSEYQKKLRLAVQSKLNELDDWLRSYELAKHLAVPNAADDRMKNLKTAISAVRSARDPSSRILRGWFEILCKASIYLPVAPLCLTRTVEPSLSVPLDRSLDDAFYPRAFAAGRNGKATVADLLADKLFICFGLYTVERLAKAYAEQCYYEAFSALSVAAPDEISVELDRRVEAGIDDLEENLSTRVNAVEAKSVTLEQPDSELIANYVAEVRLSISRQQWRNAELELSGVETTLNELLKEAEDSRLAQPILEEIIALGGEPPGAASLQTLRETLDKAIAKTQPRRQHIGCLKKLLAVEGIDPAVRGAFSATVSAMERPENLPSTAWSAEVAYVFSQTVEILRDQIRREKLFYTVYRQQLRLLALTVAASIKEDGVKEDSRVVSLLVDSEADWRQIPDGEIAVIDRLLERFSGAGYPQICVANAEIPTRDISLPVQYSPASMYEAEASTASHGIFGAYVDRLAGAVSRIGEETKGGEHTPPPTLGDSSRASKPSEAAIRARSIFERCDDPRSPLSLGYLSDWGVLILKECDEMLSTEEYAGALHLINRFHGTPAVRALLPSKTSKGKLGEITGRFLARVVRECEIVIPIPSSPIDYILALSDNIDRLITRRSLFVVSFTPVGKHDSLTGRSLWDSCSGDVRQAEARAALMNIFWQTSATEALASCLGYPPIDLERRKARAFALAAGQAFEQGRVGQLQSFIDLRKSVSARPFQVFVDLMQRAAPIHSQDPASLELVVPLEGIGGDNLYKAVLSIKPRSAERPDSITITLPQTAPVRFQNDPSLRYTLEGPFLEDESQLPIFFRLLEKNASEFSVALECDAESINGVRSKFTASVMFKISGLEPFVRPSNTEIDEAFGGFPEYQVRGEDYVPRRIDERKIEKALFESKAVRSFWIYSPRRSGKTTMLYRILDAYSHKAKRDNLVAYFTLNTSFSTNVDFNQWIWKTVSQSSANKELRNCFCNFSEIGKSLPFDADSGTFLGELSDRLMATAQISVNRVIYLVDEITRLVTMHFEGGKERKAARDITWQIRELLSQRRDIGFIFAGSSAAKKIFLSSPEAPFFNTGMAFELTPFSCENSEQESAARAIVEPLRMRGRFQLCKKTLEHLIWICAGIPYYMKLLAGATLAAAKQPYLLVSDVNSGLRGLLSKTTGIPKLDELSGNPGSDELSTIALESREDRLLTYAVVYAVAEMHSPVSGHRLFRGKLFSAECPLVSRYSMPREKIEKGLELAIDLGILRRSSDTYQNISFATPILGEAIRYSCGSFWGSVEHQLENLITESGTP